MGLSQLAQPIDLSGVALEATAQAVKAKTDPLTPSRLDVDVSSRATAAAIFSEYRIKSAPTTGQIIVPILSAGPTVTSGGVWTYGAWVQITAGVAYDALILELCSLITGGSVTPDDRFQIGAGAAGSEVVVAELTTILVVSTLDTNLRLPLVIPAFVPANTRLAVRFASELAINGSNPGTSTDTRLLLARISDLEGY